MKDVIRYNLLRFIRFLRRHTSRKNRDLPYYILVLGAFIVVVTGLNLFVELADEIGGKALKAYDDRIFEYVWSFRPQLDELFLFISDFGGVTGYIIATVIVTAFLFWKFRHWEFVLQLLLVIIISGLSNQFLKDVFQRARPSLENMMVVAESLSFPSGHAMASMSYYGFLAYLLFHIKMRKRIRWAVFALLVFLIAAIGLSRIYIGVHYPSDVAAGYIAGLIWLMFCIVLFTVISIYRRRKARRDPEEKEENLE
jgi:undecaprenyl-diphosphatase